MRFQGFGERAVDFYEGLEADNSRAYWQDHCELYTEQVRAPMEALLGELEDEFGKPKVFRPNRDMRFSADKTPYKTHCGGVAEGRTAAYYVQVSAHGLLVAGGYFETASDQVQRYREAVDDEVRGRDLEQRLGMLVRGGWTIEGDRLKTYPRGYSADHPRVELLRHRTLYSVRSWEPDDVLHRPECLARVRAAWRQLGPLGEWLGDHVGPSSQPW